MVWAWILETSARVGDLRKMCDNCPEDEIAFEDFVKKVLDDVKRFKKHWLKENKVNPEYYPLAMAEGEFWEQFMVFLQTEETE